MIMMATQLNRFNRWMPQLLAPPVKATPSQLGIVRQSTAKEPQKPLTLIQDLGQS